MRTTWDRVRHALAFEIVGLLLVTPLGALVFGFPLHDVGVVALVGATIATAWNYLYNLLFDRVMRRLAGTTLKSIPVRIVHAVLFEAGLLAILLPFVALYLGIGLWQALVMDIAFAAFYLAYGFAFNLAYDRLFPLPEWRAAADARSQARPARDGTGAQV